MDAGWWVETVDPASGNRIQGRVERVYQNGAVDIEPKLVVIEPATLYRPLYCAKPVKVEAANCVRVKCPFA